MARLKNLDFQMAQVLYMAVSPDSSSFVSTAVNEILLAPTSMSHGGKCSLSVLSGGAKEKSEARP